METVEEAVSTPQTRPDLTEEDREAARATILQAFGHTYPLYHPLKRPKRIRWENIAIHEHEGSRPDPKPLPEEFEG